MISKIRLFLASNLKMRVYGAPISTIRGAADYFFGNMGSYFSNYLRFHVRMLCRALLCCSPKHTASRACSSPPREYCSLSEFCSPQHTAPPGQCGLAAPLPAAPLPGHDAPSGHDAVPQACCSPVHAAVPGHAAQAKNRHLFAPPVDHYFVTEGFFLMGRNYTSGS